VGTPRRAANREPTRRLSKGRPCPGAGGGRHLTCSLGEPFAGRAEKRGLGSFDSKAWCSPPRTENGGATRGARDDFRKGLGCAQERGSSCEGSRLADLLGGASPVHESRKRSVRGPENRGSCPRVVLCCRNLQTASDGEAGGGEKPRRTEPYSPEREPRVKSAGSRIVADHQEGHGAEAPGRVLLGGRRSCPGKARVAYTGTRVEAGSAEPEVESQKTRAPGKRRDVRGAVGNARSKETKSPRSRSGPPKWGSTAVTEGLIGEGKGRELSAEPIASETRMLDFENLGCGLQTSARRAC
jgi:hypothetical protein